MTTATDHYSPMTYYYSPTTDYYHYSPARVNSFQTNPIQSRQIHTDVHKSLLFTSMREKRLDRFPDRLLLINSNLHNILQVSTDRLTWVNFTNSGYFWKLIMVHSIYKKTDSKDRRQVQFWGPKIQVQNWGSKLRSKIALSPPHKDSCNPSPLVIL